MSPVNSNQSILTVKCSGGLGNQMFVYAAGLFFARKCGKTPQFVKPIARQQFFNGFARPFQLEAFAIHEQIREATLFDRFYFSENPRLKQLQAAAAGMFAAELISEPKEYCFYPNLHITPSSRITFLRGYWQAAGYVDSVQSELREQFKLRAPVLDRNLKFADRIQSLSCPISVHLRFGDYAQITHASGAQNAVVSNVLPSCYFEQAIAFVRKNIDNPTFVVFSDDQSSARALLHGISSCLFIDGNATSSAYEDLWLMSQCAHHIIANSSFSWWGAWLNPRSNKQVFAPRYWFNTRESYHPDLFPPGWTTLDNLSPHSGEISTLAE